MRGPRIQAPPAVPLARDPVCGTFVVPSRALSGGTGDDIRFFCSEKCRRTYEAKRR
jgi:YHS domain-containing protein